MARQETRPWGALRELRPSGLHIRRQVAIGRSVVDFACLKARVVVEIDGGQHGREPVVGRDRERGIALRSLGFCVLRFWNAEVDGNLSGVVETIVAALPTAGPTPALRFPPARPSPPGREGWAR